MTPPFDTIVRLADTGVSLDEIAGRRDVSSESTIKNPELNCLCRKVDQLSDDGQKALMIVLDSLVNRSRVSRVMAETERLKGKLMEPNLNQERQQAHALLDMLPAEKLNAVRSLLEVMVEPLARSLALAPVEEEEITPEAAAALDRARASLARGEGIPHEEILREFGLNQ